MFIKSCRVRKIIIAVLAVAAIVFILPEAAIASSEDIINISDNALKESLLALPGVDSNSDLQLTESELSALSGTLDLHSKGISNIAGLEFATGITELNLSDNNIRDISCLALSIDRLPLVSLDLTGNYLDLTEGSEDKAAIDTISAKCTVTVGTQNAIPVEGISLDISNLEACSSDTITLTASISPADAANKLVSWSSDNTNVATVTDGVVSILTEGTANIKATTQDGGHEASCTIIVKANTITSSKYITSGTLLKGISKSTVLPTFISNLSNAAGNVKVLKADGTELTSGILGTGMSVQLFVDGKLRDTKSIVVNGDTNGDGMVDILDYTNTRLQILNISELKDAYLASADVDNNGVVDILDYTAIRLDILNLQPLQGMLPDLPEVPSGKIRAFLDKALAQLGKPYVWSTEGPDSFDCSGYIYYCLSQVGYPAGRSTANTYSINEKWQYVDRNELQPGDLMFYWSDSKPGYIGHVGIYLGNGYHIHASSDYGYVVICQITGWYDRMLSHGRRVNF